MYYGEKPDYERKEIRVDIKPVLKIKEYDSIPISKVIDYFSSVISVHECPNKKEIQVKFESHEESKGFEYPDTYIEIQPYYMREETDKEYNERITEEEKEYNEFLEAEKLKETEYSQYQKDIAEYNRIKEKYKLY